MNSLSMIKFFLFAFFLSLNLSAKARLAIGPGAMKAGGHIHMPITFPKGGHAIVGLDIAPSFDYFVSRGFSLGISTSVGRVSLTGDHPWKFSIFPRGIYHVEFGGLIYPYFGASAGVEWSTEIKGIAFLLAAPVGILIALNSHVAIDFGVPVQFIFSGDGYLGAKLPIGYLGVQAFF